MVAWWRRLSLRSRLTLLAVGGLAAGLAVGGAVLVAALGVTLQRSVDSEATQTGRDVARLVAEGALPEPVPVTGEQQVQVVDGQGRVLAASLNADRLVPVLHDAELAAVRGGGKRFVAGDRIGVTGPVRVVAVPAGAGGTGPPTVLVAKPMTDLQHSVQVARNILVVAFPLLIGVLAVVTWRLVGATLRPVESLRAGAAEITAAPSGRPARLPVPASHDEIQRLAVTLNDMLERLETARARQRAFVADAAHELRSPLANLRTELEVAQRLGDRTDWPEVARDLLADTQRLGRLIDDLLLLARADAPHPRVGAVEPVELGGLLRAVAEQYSGAAVPVSVAADQPAWVEGEPDGLRRVVANLVDNAVRHARTGVVLAVRPDRTELLVTVTDDGPGIPAADRERVFERFTRLDDARARDAGGAGLGLAIARDLVRRHGGSVRLADAGPGVRAEVRLPSTNVT
ncbi:MAG: HAMP domain-containing protein [Micromonosporaceae bacterium]|nr:HAMP domain-containing protein [Micromonosporaceae bacterium]